MDKFNSANGFSENEKVFFLSCIGICSYGRSLLFFSLLLYLASCSSSEQLPVELTVNSFPSTETIVPQEITITSELMNPFNMFVSGNHLVVYQVQVDTVFTVFELPSCKFLFKDGVIGEGPDDVPAFLDRKRFTPTPKGFKTLVGGLGKIYHFDILDNRIQLNAQECESFPETGNINNYIPVNDTLYVHMNMMQDDYEWEWHSVDGERAGDFSTYPSWHEYEASPTDLIFMYLSMGTAKPSGDRFATFYAYFKHMRIYDADRKLLRDVTINDGETWEFSRVSTQRKPYYDCFSTSTDQYIINCCRTSEKDRNEFHVFDWDGNPVKKFIVNQNIKCFTYHEGRIYAANNEEEDKLYVYDIKL